MTELDERQLFERPAPSGSCVPWSAESLHRLTTSRRHLGRQCFGRGQDKVVYRHVRFPHFGGSRLYDGAWHLHILRHSST
jgi:hypothetical protein